MPPFFRSPRPLLHALAATLALAAVAHAADGSPALAETDLVSDRSGVAKVTDANLVNAWGIAFLPTGPFWVADNGAGTLTVYLSNGAPFPPAPSPALVVSVPGADGPGVPTGLVANPDGGFTVSAGGLAGPSLFLAATEEGTIVGWSPGVDLTHAIVGADRSTDGAIYKGAALAKDGSASLLFATDFHNAHVDAFDASFHLVRQFTDERLPRGFAPFGIRAIDGLLYVTFAKQLEPERKDDAAGPGNGFVDVFDVRGRLVRRLVARGPLNSPWGLAVAPDGFGQFSRALLVGNFGDGAIHAFDRRSGRPLGEPRDAECRPIRIDGLWGLTFGNDFLAGEPDILYFTAGPGDEQHGLFGKLKLARAGCDDDSRHDDDDHDGRSDR